MEFQEEICKVCLEKHEHCRPIDGNTTNILSTFLPKTDVTTIQGPFICKNCADMLTRCYDFKTMCLLTYKSIVSMVNKNSVKLKLKDLYLSKNATVTGVPEHQDICGLCVGLVKNVPAASPFILEKMTKLCLPELDLSIVDRLVICAQCLGSLENCFRFVTNCLIVEEKIKKYCDTLDVDCKGEIELSDALQFAIKHSRRFGDEKSLDEREIGNGGDKIKLEKTFVDDFEHSIEDVKITNEMDYEEDEHQLFSSKNMLPFEEKSYIPDFVKTEGLLCEENKVEYKGEHLVETVGQTTLLNEKVEIKTEDGNFNRIKDSTVLSQQKTTTLLKRQKHLPSDLEGDERTPYIEENLLNHLRKHNDRLKVTIYQCDLCSYQTKRKDHIKSHLLKHKDPPEITAYKCAHCLFEAKRKHDLKRHLLKHKDISEITAYKCTHCLFQTKRKHGLKKHLLTHEDSSQLPMHKCGFCLYQTQYKNNLKNHMLKHPLEVKVENASEAKVYKCAFCLYQTVFKNYLNKHSLTHKNPSEVKMYKCEFCSYQSKYAADLKRHNMLNHTDLSGLPIYKCSSCSFQTIRKTNLNTHSVKHKDPSEVTMYKCDRCSYQSKYKNCLKQHFTNRHEKKLQVL